MPLSLNNSKDIVANSISIIKGNKTVDLLSSLDAVTGLAPATLNSLEKLATALNNDSGFFNTVTTAIGNKADTSTTYTKSADISYRRYKVILYKPLKEWWVMK